MSEALPPRQRILAAADDLFRRHGIRGVGVEAIAEAAGTNKMTLYRHFESKDELIAEWMRGIIAQKDAVVGRDRREASQRSRRRSSSIGAGAPQRRSRRWKSADRRSSMRSPSCRRSDHPARKVIDEHRTREHERIARALSRGRVPGSRADGGSVLLSARGREVLRAVHRPQARRRASRAARRLDGRGAGQGAKARPRKGRARKPAARGRSRSVSSAASRRIRSASARASVSACSADVEACLGLRLQPRQLPRRPPACAGLDGPLGLLAQPLRPASAASVVIVSACSTASARQPLGLGAGPLQRLLGLPAQRGGPLDGLGAHLLALGRGAWRSSSASALALASSSSAVRRPPRSAGRPPGGPPPGSARPRRPPRSAAARPRRAAGGPPPAVRPSWRGTPWCRPSPSP